MRAVLILPVSVAASIALFAVITAKSSASSEGASPIYGVTIPTGYRQCGLIAPAQEAEPLDELRAVLGNTVATEAYGRGALPFPDGTVLVKLAWRRVQSPEFQPASVPGPATTVQIMTKDSDGSGRLHGP